MPVDSESAVPEGKTDSQAEEQSFAARKTVKMVEGLFRTAKRARMNYDKDWVENYKFFRGKQWTESRPSYRHSEVLNFIYSTIQTIVPILTDSRPNIETMPENPADFEFSEIMTHILTSKFDRDTWGQVVADAVIDSVIYGTAITEQPWDPDLLDGLGDFEFKTVDPVHFYPNPDATDINAEDNKYIIIAKPEDLNEIKRKYPKKAHLLKSDIADIDMAKTAKLDMDDYRVRSPTDNLSLVQGERTQDADMPNQILVITCWLRDETLVEEEIKKKSAEGNLKKGFRTKKKYPNGRKIVIAGGQLLEDMENPYIDGKFPYTKLISSSLPREFWGQGEVEQLKGPQQILNKLMSYALDVLSLMGNPVWKNPTGSGVFSETLTNQPGLVIDHIDGFEPRREMGADVQPSIFQAFDRMRDVFDQISGIHEVTRGAEPRNASGVAIDALQEAAQTKLRLLGRNIEAWLTKAGQQQSSRILQFYTVPRIVRLTDNENASKYFKIAIDETTDELGEFQKVATVQAFENSELGNVVEGDIQQFEIKGQLDIKVTTGTSLPFAKAKREAQAEKLYQLGIYDEEDLLTDLEHPRKVQILEKFFQRQQAQAEAEMAQAQAQSLAQPQAKLSRGLIPGAASEAPPPPAALGR